MTVILISESFFFKLLMYVLELLYGRWSSSSLRQPFPPSVFRNQPTATHHQLYEPLAPPLLLTHRIYICQRLNTSRRTPDFLRSIFCTYQARYRGVVLSQFVEIVTNNKQGSTKPHFTFFGKNFRKTWKITKLCEKTMKIEENNALRYFWTLSISIRVLLITG